MKYSKIKIIFLASIALVFFSISGCKKYLDQQPITELGPEQVFNSVPSTLQALSASYSRLVGDQGYGIRLSLYYPLDNDEMQGPTGNSDNDRRDIARYLATSGNAQLEKPFNQLFQGIEYANICIDNIPKMALYDGGSDNEKKQLRRMLGEAYTLRAQFYFEAIRNWGDLPAHFEPAYSLASADPFPKQVDRDTLYNHLISDLQLAETLVPWNSEVTSIGDQPDERITKGTVKGLLARIALFRGGYSLRKDAQMKRGADYLTYYQVARKQALEVMSSGHHTLNPSYKDLWKNQVCGHVSVDPNGELMFQASGIGLTGSEDTKLGYYNGPRVNNKGNSSVNPLATYFYFFDSTDIRRDVTCCPYWTGSDGITKIGKPIANMTDGKYRRDWIKNPVIAPNSSVQYLGLNWQILRYSDVILMFAEAENEINGPTADAYNALNMVRRRGFGLPMNTVSAQDIPAGLSKADFQKAVIRERTLELGGEGVRKYDLIRWNLLGTAINEVKANLLRMSTSTPVENPTYMLGYPSYSISSTLPVYMYYYTGTTAESSNIGELFFNSLYRPAPTSTPAGTTRVNWVRGEINTSELARYATGFTPGKSELLPFSNPTLTANFNIKQNP